MKKVLLVGGGTAGHIYPLLAVARKMRGQVELHYIGQRSDVASASIANSDLELHTHSIIAGKLNRYLTWKHLSQAGKAIVGLAQAERRLASIKPDVIFAKGGFVSLPVVLAAARRGIPIFAHETDVIPGLANRLISKYAKTVFTAFPVESYRQLDSKKLFYSGQPLRPAFYQEAGELNLPGFNLDKAVITVIGGSQGAHNLNELVKGAWPKLLEVAQVVHLCGSRDFSELQVEAAKKSWSNPLLVLDFFEDVAGLFKRSQVVVSRAGGTIFELAACRVASILVPLPTAAQDHQLANARVLEKAGAAMVLQEKDLSSAILADNIVQLLSDADKRRQLVGNIAQFAKPDAAKLMSEIILSSTKPD